MQDLLHSDFFFFNDTATTEIYTLSLHDALPIWSLTSRPRSSAPEPTSTTPAPRTPRPRHRPRRRRSPWWTPSDLRLRGLCLGLGDRKSTRLNSSHGYISYAVFCLKKKNKSAAPIILVIQRSILRV